jgi:methylated-DNA-protein-cysteine methyltransferase-like protein
MTKTKQKALVKPMPSGWSPIYKLVKQVPRGCVVTYGEVAKFLRMRGGARVVGYAMAATPRGQGVPWHRVLGAGGKILLREPTAGLQRKLLESEGVRFLETRVDLAKHSWKAARRVKRRNSPGSRRTH